MIRCDNCSETNRVTATFCQRCGQRLPADALLVAGWVVQGRYRVIRLVGRGGMGAVYEAEDLRLQGRKLALKEMSDAAIKDPQEVQKAIAGFQHEASMLAHLIHPNIPRVTDFFSEPPRHYIVMELVPGETLEEALQRRGQPFTDGVVRGWALQLCDVLIYLHNQIPPIIFRDLKPNNIMLTPTGKVSLIDFGIARLFKPGKQNDTRILGAPGFASPEQWGHGQTDVRSDIYSLGVVMHYLLTCHPPATQLSSLPPIHSLNPAVSSELAHVIERATQPQAQGRYQSVAEMKQALEQGVPRTTVVAPPPPPLPPPPVAPLPARFPTSSLLLVGILLLVVGLGAAAFGAGAFDNSVTATDTSSKELALDDKSVTASPADDALSPTADASVDSTPSSTADDLDEEETLAEAEPQPTDTATPTPTDTATPSATSASSPSPSATASATMAPSATPTPFPTPTSASLSSQFAFTNCVGRCAVYLWDILEGRASPLIQDNSKNQQAAWAPGGDQLVFSSTRSDGWEQLHLYEMTTKKVLQLTTGVDHKVRPAWSPHNTQILYQQYNDEAGKEVHIWAVPSSGGEVRNLTDGSAGWNKTPEWSPTADQIVYSAAPGDTNRDGEVDDSDERNLYLMDANGNNRRRLTDDPNFYDMYPQWLPDGQHVLFSRHAKAAQFNNNGPGDIYLINIVSGDLRVLTNGSANEEMAVPSPQGDQLLIVRDDGGGPVIYLVPFQNGQLGTFEDLVEGSIPAWRPSK